MQEKYVVDFFIGIVIIVAILFTLSTIAVPEVCRMVEENGSKSCQSESRETQTPAIEKLQESHNSQLTPVGSRG